MAAYRRVYDSRHLQADCQEPDFHLKQFDLHNAVSFRRDKYGLLQSTNRSIYCYMTARRLDYTVRQIIKKHHSHCKLFLNLLLFANIRGSLLETTARFTFCTHVLIACQFKRKQFRCPVRVLKLHYFTLKMLRPFS